MRCALHADQRHVLQPLPAGQQVEAAIADADDARDRGERPVGVGLEVPHEGAHEIGMGLRVGVHGDDDVPRGRAQPGVQRRRLAPVRLPDHADARIEGVGEPVDDVACAVGRPVVDDEELQYGVAAGDQRPQGRLDDLRLVVGRDQHSHPHGGTGHGGVPQRWRWPPAPADRCEQGVAEGRGRDPGDAGDEQPAEDAVRSDQPGLRERGHRAVLIASPGPAGPLTAAAGGRARRGSRSGTRRPRRRGRGGAPRSRACGAGRRRRRA